MISISQDSKTNKRTLAFFQRSKRAQKLQKNPMGKQGFFSTPKHMLFFRHFKIVVTKICLHGQSIHDPSNNVLLRVADLLLPAGHVLWPLRPRYRRKAGFLLLWPTFGDSSASFQCRTKNKTPANCCGFLCKEIREKRLDFGNQPLQVRLLSKPCYM